MRDGGGAAGRHGGVVKTSVVVKEDIDSCGQGGGDWCEEDREICQGGAVHVRDI